MKSVMSAMANDINSIQTDPALVSFASSKCVGGVAGGYPCHNVDLAAHLPLTAFFNSDRGFLFFNFDSCLLICLSKPVISGVGKITRTNAFML